MAPPIAYLLAVSIPSSSGHQFTAYSRRGTTSWTSAGFQSLLHQGISLLQEATEQEFELHVQVSIPSSSGHQFTGNSLAGGWIPALGGFNPFFIRASVYWLRAMQSPARHMPLLFQSLLHQGISLLAYIGPLSLPENARFQSLLHQGISLLGVRTPAKRAGTETVSIPSSSGHQFTARETRHGTR